MSHVKVTFCLVNSDTIIVKSMQDDNIADLVDFLHKADPDDWVSVTLNASQDSVAHMRLANICAVILDQEDAE